MRLPALSALATIAALVAAPAMAQSTARAPDPGVKGPPDGTVTISAKAAAVGVGYTWGDGVLRYHGHTYHFGVRGVSIADVGFAHVTGHGRVYNLHRIADFSGTYGALNGEATVGNGIGGEYLRNDKGVVLRVDEVSHGARLTGSADGIQLTIR